TCRPAPACDDQRAVRRDDHPRGRGRCLHRARAARDLRAGRRRAGGRARARLRPPAHPGGWPRRAGVCPRAARGCRGAPHRRASRSSGGLSQLVPFLRRWGISLASLVGGILTLFVFRRGLPRVSLIVGYLLLLWLLVAILVQVRETLETSEKRTVRLVLTATEYTIQTLYHGVLLFLLPAYWAATTLSSPNAIFLAVLIVLALLATFDPWYQALVHPRPWAGYIFFLVAMFGAL